MIDGCMCELPTSEQVQGPEARQSAGDVVRVVPWRHFRGQVNAMRQGAPLADGC